MKNRYVDEFGTLDPAGPMAWSLKLGDDLSASLCSRLTFVMSTDRRFLLVRYNNVSPFGDVDFFEAYGGIMKECRSLVIDLKKDCPALTPFRKFRNLGECPETSEESIRDRLKDAKTVEFSDKLDGSMQSVRWYDGRLIMAGSRSVEPAESYRLSNGYDYVRNHEGYRSMVKDHKDTTFIFEYVFPDD